MTPLLSSLHDIIVSGWPKRRDEIPKQLRPYWSNRDELSVEDGVIIKGERVLIPKSIQADVEQQLHAGYQPGIEKCKLRAKFCVYWNGINNDLEEVVNRNFTISNSTQCISSLVVVPKKDSNNLIICLDPTDLNRAIQRENYPLPTIEDVATRLRTAKVFSLLDICSGFWHVKFDKPSSYLTTFNTPFGRYRWKRLPFGRPVPRGGVRWVRTNPPLRSQPQND